MRIELTNLPKVSLNQWYSGKHWTKRKKLKDIYKILVRSQTNQSFSDKNEYKVSYHFVFKNRPLDASNCVAMVKMVEDILFKNDGYKVVRGLYISSNKGKEDKLIIKILNYEKPD